MAWLWLPLLFGTLALGVPETTVPAPLTVGGETLFVFRARVGSIQPAERAKLIEERIERVARDRLFDLKQLVVRQDEEIGSELFAGDRLLLVITREDAKLEKRPARVIAETIAFRLKEIIEKDRRARSPRELLFHSLYAVAYTLALCLVLFALGRLYGRAAETIRKWQGTVIRSLRIKTVEILPADRIAQLALALLRATRVVVTLALLYFFIPLLLSLFPWTASFSPVLLGYIVTPLRQIGYGLVHFIPNLFFIALTILATRYTLKLIRIFFTEIEKGTMRFQGFYPEWGEPTYQLVRVLAIAFTLVVVFPYIPGSSSPAFQGISVFLGVLVSFGSSSAVANTFAGIVLTYMRSFRHGDRVKIADTVGDVIEKNLLVTRVRTVKNVDITIPNALVLGSHIVNYSALAPTDGLILHTEVTIGYDAPWRKVHTLLVDAALRTEGVMKVPAPFVLQSALEDSYVRYQLNAYTRHAHGMATIYSAMHQHVQDAFNEAQVEIMSPAYSAVRDGNTVTIPPEKRPAGYRAPSFRIGQPVGEPPLTSSDERNAKLDA